MSQFKTEPERIAMWLRAAIPRAMVDVVESDRETAFLFKIYDRDRAPYPTLVVSWEALEDWTPEEIFADFERGKLTDLLRQHPDKRVFYRNSRQIMIQGD